MGCTRASGLHQGEWVEQLGKTGSFLEPQPGLKAAAHLAPRTPASRPRDFDTSHLLLFCNPARDEYNRPPNHTAQSQRGPPGLPGELK